VKNAVDTRQLAKKLRASAVRMTHKARASHVGSCLSMADLLAVLYGAVLRFDPKRPSWPDRDRFLLSKGHAGAIVYAALAETGFFPRDWLDRYCEDGSPLAGHISHHDVPGVEASTGSLGHGLSIGCGMALAGRADRKDYQVFVMLSDGECDEGSTWEAVLFAGHHKLRNLTVIVDCNGIQSLGYVKDILDLKPFPEKWQSFGWQVEEIDGHNHDAIHSALAGANSAAPRVIIAHTVKGKGVSFMEDQLAWHYKSVNEQQLANALREIEMAE
jgi:transketolase